VWIYHHIATLSLKWTPFIKSYGPFPRILVCYVAFARTTYIYPHSMDSCSVLVSWIFLLLLQRLLFMLTACTFVPTLGTTVKPRPWTFSLHSSDVHSCSQFTSFCWHSMDLWTFVCVCATPPCTTHYHWLWYHLLGYSTIYHTLPLALIPLVREIDTL
jgi:hypothetical protein